MSLVSSAQAMLVPEVCTTSSTPTTPKALKIRFTNASDLRRVSDFFNSERKKAMDPQGKIRARSEAELIAPIETGSAIIALDDQDEIRFFGMASDYFSVGEHAINVTELGAIMCDVRGFKLAQVASAMLSLKEAIRLREAHPGIVTMGVHALVAKDNSAAHKVFAKDLAWRDIPSETERTQLFMTQNKHACEQSRSSRVWYEFGKTARDTARGVIAKPLSQGYLSSKHGQRIEVDFDDITPVLM